MSVRSFSAFSLAIITALLVASAFPAMGKNSSRQVVVSREAKLGGKVVAPGRYTIVFDEGREGDVALVKEGREVLKVTYKLSELDKQASESVVVFVAGTDGSLEIRRIELKGMKAALLFQ